MQRTIPTVTQVVNQVKSLLESQFQGVQLVGEISNLSRSGAGHYYFTLSDSQSSLSACLFRGDAMRNTLIKDLKDGDKVIAAGGLGVYGKRGTFQLIVKRLSPAGEGDLKLQLEKLKKRLAAEGLFDMEIKKPLPKFAKRVGLITAEGSAAYHDFLNVVNRRSLFFDILLAPAMVQGDRAPESLRKSLINLIQYHQNAPEDKKLDVIVLTRGGGSLEDLWAFNDEALAWEIYNCPLPIISAVGHEVDFSISDYVADFRCETPSTAAEVLTQGQVELLNRMKNYKKTLEDFGDGMAKDYLYRLERMSPIQNLRTLETKLYRYKERLSECRLQGRLAEFTGLHDYTFRLEDCYNTLMKFPHQVESLKNKLENQNNVLRVLNPNNTLGRGYCYVKNEKSALISDTSKFDRTKDKEKLTLFFKDGQRIVTKEAN